MPQWNFPGLKSGSKWCLCIDRWLDAESAGKAPFVTLLGLQGAKEKAQQLIYQAINELEALPVASNNLKAAAQFVISRDL